MVTRRDARTLRGRHFTYRLRTIFVGCTFVAVYLSAYRGLLTPDHVVSASAGGVFHGSREPNFRYGGRLSRIVFLPASSIDRLIRPNYWKHFSSTEWDRNSTAETVDYSWGHIVFIGGRATSMSLYADTEEDVEAALIMLRDTETASAIRVNGVAFNDQHLQSLSGFQTLDSLELLATSVTAEVVNEFRRGHPNVGLVCFARTEDGIQLY